MSTCGIREPLTPEQTERVDELRTLDKVTLAVKLVRAQDALAKQSPSSETGIRGEKSKAGYSPARSVAQDGEQHLYVFHDGLWYHFPPKGWTKPLPEAPK